jgi:putative aldouronate transport system permease protein
MKNRRKNFKRYIPLYIMAFPGMLYLFINNYLPLPGLILAFKKFNAKKGIFGSPFVGFKNFKYLFATKDAFVITRNTILYNLVFIIVNTIMAIRISSRLSPRTPPLLIFSNFPLIATSFSAMPE